MEYSKLIHDFFDGTLDAQQENELFMMISSNDEVRAEFKHSLSLDKALNKKLSSFAPSAKSTVGLFSQLGFTAPASLSGVTKPPGAIISTLKKYSQGLAGAASMAVVSVVVFLLLDYAGGNSGIRNNSIAENNNVENNNVENNNANNKIVENNIEITATTQKKDIPVVESFSTEQNNTEQNNTEQNNTPTIRNGNNMVEQNNPSTVRNNKNLNDNYAKSINSKPASAIDNSIDNSIDNNDNIAMLDRPEQKDEKQTNDLFSDNIPEAETYNLAFDISKSDVAANLTAPIFEQANNSGAIGFVPVIDGPRYDNYIAPMGLSLSIHGNEYWQLNPNSVPESTVPIFNNMGLTMLYDISEDWSIGFDLRQEHFYQEFTVAGDNGIDYLYQQTPNYITYSAVAKYDFYKFDYVSLFAQSMAGMAATGGIGRLMAGAEYSPNSAYSFLIGMEYSVLAFKDNNNSTYYFAPKLGFNYSVIIKL